MKERGNIDDNFEVSESVFNPYPTFTKTIVTVTSETSVTDVSLTTDSPPSCSFEIPNIIPNLVETAPGTSTDPCLTTTDPVSTISLCKQSMESIRLDYFLWLVNRFTENAVDLGYVVPDSQL